MYHGEVCISQEGLSSLVKCAELLQVKGLCGNETTSIISKDSSSQPKIKNNEGSHDEVEQSSPDCSSNTETQEMIEIDANESEYCEYNDQMMIKREINISKKFLFNC